MRTRAGLQPARNLVDSALVTMPAQIPSDTDDPRRLREILDRALELASRHALTSVLVGIAGYEGDPAASRRSCAYVESGLRVDDSVFRMTRERAVLLLTDVDAPQRRGDRARACSPSSRSTSRRPRIRRRGRDSFEVAPSTIELTLKQVLPRLFPGPPAAH